MLRLGSDDRRIQGDSHGDRIRQRDAVFAGLFEEGLLGAAVALDGEFGHGRAETKNLLNVRWIEDSAAAAEMPAHEFDGKAAAHDDAGGFGITPDVVFGGGSDVALAAGRAAHNHTTTYSRGDTGPFLQGEGDICQRAQGDQDEARVRFDGVDDCVEGRLLLGRASRGWIAVIAEAVVSVKPRGADMRALERLFGACEDWNLRIAQLGGVEGVAAGLMDVDVTGYRSDGVNLDVRRAQRHDQGDGVVGGSVGIDKKGKFHARQNIKLVDETLNKKPVDDCRGRAEEWSLRNRDLYIPEPAIS